MINYGAGPSADEIEVTVFGPGYGEAVSVHVGSGTWILVDSCIDPSSGLPASETYLTQIGVSPTKVSAIVASHWHDDHVRGISRLAEIYSDAEFFLSSVFNNREAAYFLAGYGGNAAPGEAKGGVELFRVIERKGEVYFVHQHSNVMDIPLEARNVNVMAFSPVHAAVAQSVAHMALYLPSDSQAINHAPELNPNLEAVAIHIEVGDGSILLGSDLLEDDVRGWSAVIRDRRCSIRRASSVYKVAHHGSHSGDTPAIWETLLADDPVACMTPFIRGNQRLPTEMDRARIRSYTANAYISSNTSRRPTMEASQRKRLESIGRNITPLNPGFGAVRMRRPFGAQAWTVECFGSSQRL